MHEEVFAGTQGHKGGRASLPKCMLTEIFVRRSKRARSPCIFAFVGSEAYRAGYLREGGRGLPSNLRPSIVPFIHARLQGISCFSVSR